MHGQLALAKQKQKKLTDAKRLLANINVGLEEKNNS